MEKILIKLIESCNRIMGKWDKLILRRTILNVFTVMLFSQIIVTTLLWIFKREISSTWLGVLTIEFGAWGTMIGFYFSERSQEERDRRK